MFDVHRVRQDFSNAARQYEMQTPLQKHALSQLMAKTLPLLPSRARLLDVGCGTGRLAKRCPQHHVTQVDAAHQMCREAATTNAPAAAATVEMLPFTDVAFDGVICSLVLQWVDEKKLAMQEMQRVLKRGGILAVCTFGPGTLKELRESFAAADRYPHVSEFAAPGAFDAREVVMEYYPDLFSLMNHLKITGARNKLVEGRKSMMTRRQMERVDRRYRERFATSSGLPVTWEILYSVTRKP